MELRILFPILTMMYTGFLHTVSPARVNAQSLDSTAATRTERHARTKRCSCATFLDKECVYFCHLDIIWVNTPERVVSYGLGNTPRRRRATRDPSVTKRDPRCACVREEDSTCADFCQLEQNLRSAAAPDAVNAAAPDAVIPAARGDGYAHGQRGHALAAKTGRIRRVRGGGRGAELTAALRSRLLRRNWRGRGGGAGRGPGRTRGPWPGGNGR